MVNASQDLSALLDNATQAYKNYEPIPSVEDIINSILKLAKDGTHATIRAKILRALLWLREFKVDESLSLLASTKEEVITLYDKMLTCEVCLATGHALRQKFTSANNEMALEEYERVLCDGQQPNRLLKTEAFIGKGHALRMLNRYNDSLDAYDLAIANCDADNYNLASAHAGKGNTLRALNCFEEAWEAFKKARRIAQNNMEAKVSALLGSANVLRRYGYFGHAIREYENALKISRDIGDVLACGNALIGIGSAHSEQKKNFTQAIEAYDLALEEIAGRGDLYAEATALTGKGNSLLAAGSLHEAFDAYKKAVEISKHSGNKRAIATSLIGLGVITAEKKEIEDSDDHFNNAVDIGREIAYGYAIMRGKAGCRLLSNSAQDSLPLSLSGATLTPEEAQKRCELHRDYITRMYGPDALTGLPSNEVNQTRWLNAMLPSQEVWAVALICDIRGYTSIVAKMSIARQLKLLNTYLTKGTRHILSFGGGVDKYMGDAILGFFLPVGTCHYVTNREDIGRTVRDAIDAAVAIAEDPELHTLFKRDSARQTTGDSNFGIGIGIAVGTVKLGEIGASWCRQYTLIGDPINLAARLQSEAKSWEIIATCEAVNILKSVPALSNDFSFSWPDNRERPEIKGYSDVTMLIVGKSEKPD